MMYQTNSLFPGEGKDVCGKLIPGIIRKIHHAEARRRRGAEFLSDKFSLTTIYYIKNKDHESNMILKGIR